MSTYYVYTPEDKEEYGILLGLTLEEARQTAQSCNHGLIENGAKDTAALIICRETGETYDYVS